MKSNLDNVFVPGYTSNSVGIYYHNKLIARPGLDYATDEELMKKFLIDEGVVIKTRKSLHNTQNKKALILEPHPDDIALSAGGLILNLIDKGYRIEVLTVFSDFSKSTFPWQDVTITENEYNELRKKETRACFNKYLGQNVRCLNQKTALKLGYKSPFSPITESSDKLIANIEKLIRKITEENFDTIVFPGGFGKHIDHQTVFKSISKILPSLLSKKINIYLYYDYPYAKEYSSFAMQKKVLDKTYNYKEFYLDITDYLEDMADMATIYKSQFDDINRTQRLAIIMEDARVTARDAQINTRTEFAQNFLLLKSVK